MPVQSLIFSFISFAVIYIPSRRIMTALASDIAPLKKYDSPYPRSVRQTSVVDNRIYIHFHFSNPPLSVFPPLSRILQTAFFALCNQLFYAFLRIYVQYSTRLFSIRLSPVLPTNPNTNRKTSCSRLLYSAQP